MADSSLVWLSTYLSFSADQIGTAGLVEECTMFRDVLQCLPDAFTVGDFTDIAYCVRVDCCLLSMFLFFFLYFVNDL